MFIEALKMRRTGIIPALLMGMLLAAAVPILFMLAKSEEYCNLPGNPIDIILKSSWQIMAMIFIILMIVSTCVIYHTEYADHANLHMSVLPQFEGKNFFLKFLLLAAIQFAILFFSMLSIIFVCFHWFHMDNSTLTYMIKTFLFNFVLLLPMIMISLFLAQIFENMWIPLGVGVICYAFASMMIPKAFTWAYFPYAMPMITLGQISHKQVIELLTASAGELVSVSIIELLYLKIRRVFR